MKYNRTNQLFDKIFKRMMRLSSISIINFINGLFNKDFPLDSIVTYYSTENIKDNLEKNISDFIIGISTEKFSMESQISKDNTIVLRVFEYGYYDAIKTKELKENRITLKFPYPKIIFLDDNTAIPDEYILEFLFNEDHLKPFEFKVPTLKFLSMSIEEINKNKMVIMIPLYLLKLRKEIDKDKSVENAQKLKDLINNGLLKSILENEKQGNITIEDRINLVEMIRKIYDELYGGIVMFTLEKVTEELDGDFFLESDRLIKERNKVIFELDKAKAEKEIAVKEKENAVREMLNDNVPVEKIKFYLQVTDEQINNIKNNLQ